MIDVMGAKIEVGYHVFYFRYILGGFSVEEAEVVSVRDSSIRLEFLGNLKVGKKNGSQANVFNTSGKIFILDKNITKERLMFRNRMQYLSEENIRLAKDNIRLQKDVDKIHDRFEILDL